MKRATTPGVELAPELAGAAGGRGPLKTSFVGREREVAQLVEMLSQPEPRLIVVTGLSGVGKTRLVAETCSAIERQLGSLVVFLNLAPLEHASDIPQLADVTLAAATLEGAAGRRADPGLPAGQVLVVIDNVEHLPGAGQQVLKILADAPDLRALLVSTAPLRLPGEQVLRLEPLVRSRRDELDPAELLDEPAVRLFADRALAADASSSVTEANVEVVAELCDVLGGLPLAIELAAARVPALAPEQLLGQLGDPAGLDLLTGSSGESGRQDSMRGALGWTVALLSEPARQLLAILSVFEGPFSREGLSALCGPDWGTSRTFDALCELVEVRLVEPCAGPGTARFAPPPLVRSFARLALVAEDTRQESEARHTDYVISLGKKAAESFERGAQSEAFALLGPEWAEITAVLDRLVRQGEPGRALQLSVDCAPFLLGAGFDASARGRLELLIEVAQSRGPAGRDGTLARALLWSALLARQARDVSLHIGWASRRLAEGLEMAREIGDAKAELLGLELTVLALPLTGDVEAASTAVEQGRKMAAEAGHEGRLARFEAFSAMLAQLRGDDSGALALGTAALLRARRRGDLQATVLASLLLLSGPPRNYM
ncbi:MAG: AAA family ATPase, partial [Actinomycetota bacterium]|nr:AAA family ATPase [Actinomycetota bacterium]